MNVEEVRNYCLAKNGVTEEFPFDEDTLVFKVMNKIFLLTSLSSRPFTCNLKMKPEQINSYREKYSEVMPGYHMNKRHWNTVIFEGASIPGKELLWMIDHSYEQVIKGMPKKWQQELNSL